ncbi:hypothetical protein IFR05_002394 [Cadophora sp. M221]|nr:hypothetical protein IFR05_002394 [Cadophora sp. M221]
MARVVDPTRPNARIVIVQGAPDNEVVNLINKTCAPIAEESMEGSAVDHQGILLATAARVFARCVFGDVSVARVDAHCNFPEEDLSTRCERAATVLAEFWYRNHPRCGDMKDAFQPILQEHFANRAFEVGDQAVILIAKPTTTFSATTATPSDNSVSWQSIFFGLTALALNAMTQRSYVDELFPASSILFAMRSSPFVCIADLIEIIAVAIFHFVQRQTVKGRFPLGTLTDQDFDDGILAMEEKGDGEMASGTFAESHPWVVLIFFVGTSTQAVKIFGFQGVLWAKLWAASYLLSYMAVALLPIFLPYDQRQEPIIGRYRIRRWAIVNLRIVLHFFALAAHFFFYCWTAYQLVHLDLSVLQQHPVPVGFWGYLIRIPFIGASAIGAIAVFSPLWIFILPSVWAVGTLLRLMVDLQQVQQDANPQSFRVRIQLTARIWLCCIGTLLAVAVGMAIFMCSVATYMDFRLHAADVVAQGLSLSLFFGIPCFALIQYLISGEFRQSGIVPSLSYSSSDLWNKACLITFAVMNFGIAILYYSIRYDPQGTIKPVWTEDLG